MKIKTLLTRKKKGEYGYLKTNQRYNLTMAVICAVVVVIMISIGFALWHTRLNMLMIPAMVCVIPTANYLVAFLAVCMFDTPDAAQYEQIKAFDEAGMLVSELVLVDEKGGRNNVDFCVVYTGGVVAFQSTRKDTRDMTEITVNQTMKRRSIPMRMKVYRNWNEFIKRLNQLEQPSCEEDMAKIRQAQETLISISI